MSYPISVHVFFEKEDGQVFFLRRANTGYKDGHWSVPAGRLNSGESIIQAALRESNEEAGAYIDPKYLIGPLMMHHKDRRGTRLHVYFLCQQWQNELINAEPEKCDKVGWFYPHEIPHPHLDYVMVAHAQLKAGNTYIEYGFI